MAPVAGRVSDLQHDRLFLRPGPGEGLVAPRIPVDRVVLVLAEIRAGLVGESVHGVEATQGDGRNYHAVECPAMAVLATYNVKGGVGKTATVVNLAHRAAFVGQGDGARTLVFALDPQGAAS